MSSRNHIAHITPDGKSHPLIDHLEGVARRAQTFAAASGGSSLAYLSGLWHDIGKFSRDFQSKILAAGGEEAHTETPRKVDHSSAGAQYAAKHLGDAGKVIAYTIAGHHAGLLDGISEDSCLQRRLEKTIPAIDDCPEELLKAGVPDLPLQLDSKRAAMQLSVFIRMLFSCLVDADFLDTEAFMSPEKEKARHGYVSLSDLEQPFLARLRELPLDEQSVSPKVNEQRKRILQQCLAASERDMGLFSLTVPTGGGKTLSSMAFGLRHARKHGLRRIIYVIPYTSIIEQNANVFRKMLGDDAVLEHHSNFEPAEEDHRSRLAAENWDAPVIVTTNVQFFESLWANKPNRCRKLHNIAESVIILDEVQTLPAPILLPCLEVLTELAAHYKTSIVLCSATQPAIQKREDFSSGLCGVREIMDDPRSLADEMRRTEVVVLDKVRDSELAQRITKHDQVLCVVNTRGHAKNLYRLLGDTDGIYHLSALMCPAHRTQKLEEIRAVLRAGQPCRLVSTQLIEAGVDISFPVVYRALAGIDSIAQAAGRCNRGGTCSTGKVYVFRPETVPPPGHFRQTADLADAVIRRHRDDILSLDAIEYYFRLYYWTKGDFLDEAKILQSLSERWDKLDFPFKTVAQKFQFIGDSSKPVIIPFDDQARRLIRSIEHEESPRTLARKLQSYTVTLHPHQWEELLSAGSIRVLAEMFPVLIDEGLYNDETGLSVDDLTERTPESLYI